MLDDPIASVGVSPSRRFRSLISRILHPGSFIRNVTVLSGGTALGQGMAFLALPLLSRLYPPADFGVLAVYTSIVVIASAFSSLQYEQAVVLPKEDEDATNLLLLSMGIVGVISLIAMLVVAFFGPSIATLARSPGIAPWLWLLPLSLLTIGLFRVFEYWFVRKKAFKRLAVIRLVQTLVTIGSQLAASAFLAAGVSGLIGGYVLGQMVAVMMQGWFIWQEDRLDIKTSASIDRIKSQAAVYKKFPLFSSWMFSINRLQTSMPVLFFSMFFGPAIAGSYAMTTRILLAPSSLIGAAISRVFFQTVAEEKARIGEVNHLVERVFGWLCVMGILYLLGMLFISFFFELLLGQQWSSVDEYARIMAPSFAVISVVSTISLLLGALNKQELEALWQITALVCTALFLGVGLSFRSPYVSLCLLTVSNLIVYSFYAYLLFRAAGADFRRSLFVWRNKQNTMGS